MAAGIRRRVVAVLVVVAAAAWAPPPSTAVAEPAPPGHVWQKLEPGLELGVFQSPRGSPVGDELITVLRVDPERMELVLGMASASDREGNLTALQWAREQDWVAAINSSMFRTDHRTSTELMRSADHINNAELGSGKTVLAFDARPTAPSDTPPVRILDRSCDDLDVWLPRYGSAVQSIRMLSCQGRNVWSDSDRIWSHACIGQDHDGRPLLIHARSPWSTHDFIDLLRELPLGLERLQYAEGGPEASLAVRTAATEREWVGSYETGFFESDGNEVAWPLPNVVGVKRRAASTETSGP